MPTTTAPTDDATARPTARRTVVAVLAALVVALGLVAALGAGVVVLEARAAERLELEVTERAEALLPGGRIESAEVTDTPALLADRREHVQQAVLGGRSADGYPARLFVRELDLATGRADSVSWYLEGLPVAQGWTAVVDSRGVSLNQAELVVDGQRVTVSAAARVEGGTLVVAPGEVEVDGVLVALQDAPEPVRRSLAAVTLQVPLPDAGSAGPTVGEVWFDERGAAVELEADDVDAGEG